MGQLLLRESNYSFATSAFVFLNPGKRAATDAIVDAEYNCQRVPVRR